MPAPAPDPDRAAQALAPPTEALPVAVIGAGPVGLAAAAHLLRRGAAPLVLEAGDGPGASVRAWGHVRLFSPWRALVDAGRGGPPGRGRLGGARPGPAAHRAGAGRAATWSPWRPCRRCARASATAPGCGPSPGAATTSSRRRAATAAPFVLRVRDAGRRARTEVLARAVIDASGTYASPNPLGASGLPAAGERALAGADLLRHPGRPRRPPRPLRRAPGGRGGQRPLGLQRPARPGRPRRARRRARRSPGSSGAPPGRASSAARSGTSCPPAASSAGASRRLVGGGPRPPRLPAHRRPARGRRTGSSSRGRTPPARPATLPPVDEVVATTGFRPDLAPLRELRLGLDPALEAPVGAGPADRPQRPLLRHRPAPRRAGAGPPRAGLLRGGHEELRPGADLPAADGLRAGALRRRRPDRGRGRRRAAWSWCCPETGVCSARPGRGAAAATTGDDDEAADAGVARPEPALVAAGAACCG